MVARSHFRGFLAALLVVFLIVLYNFNINLNFKSYQPKSPSKILIKPIARQRGIQKFVVDSGRTKVKRQQLPNLEQLDWPEREFLPLPLGAPGASQIPWEPQFSRGQMRTLWKLFSTFEDVMEELGLSDKWMIWAGSLVGSFRHHDIIPWDDDIDVLIDFKARSALAKKMRELAPDILFVQYGFRDKIYAKLIEPSNTSRDVEGSRKLHRHDWGWPYIDIGYYTTNATHMQELAMSNGVHPTCAMSDVFPLIFRPFYKHWVPVPINTFAAIMQPTFGKEDCYISSWSHPFEVYRQARLVSCSRLTPWYAFVEHSPLYDNSDRGNIGSRSDLIWVRERLILGNRSIHEIRLVAPRHVAHVETYRMRVVKA